MKTKTRLLALLLSLILLVLPLVSCKDDKDDSGKPDTGDEFTGSIAGDDATDEPEPDVTPTPPPLAEGDANATVYITSYEDLKAKLTQKGTFVLQNDITVDAADFKPFGNYIYPFLGTLDGGGHKITLKVSTSEENYGYSPMFKYVYCGLFSVTKNATVKNLTLDVDLSAASSTASCFVLSGAVAGYMIDTTVVNCTISGKITSKSEYFNAYSGSICGIMDGGKITSCSTAATVEAIGSQNRAVAGGIIAYTFGQSEIAGCFSASSVKASSTEGVAYAGGLVGNAKASSFTACGVDATVHSEVTKYVATAKTHGAAYAGGIVAVAGGDHEAKRVSFTRCYAQDGTVTALGNNNFAYGAGICGAVIYADFKHCYSLTDITVKTGINLAYAASAFASITSTGSSSSDGSTYIHSFSIDGCYAGGDVSATHSKPQFMFLATYYGYTSDSKASAAIKKPIYSEDAVYTLNGRDGFILNKNGTAKPSAFFTLENCSTELGWSDTEWEYDGDILKAK